MYFVFSVKSLSDYLCLICLYLFIYLLLSFLPWFHICLSLSLWGILIYYLWMLVLHHKLLSLNIIPFLLNIRWRLCSFAYENWVQGSSVYNLYILTVLENNNLCFLVFYLLCLGLCMLDRIRLFIGSGFQGPLLLVIGCQKLVDAVCLNLPWTFTL